jgi:hypothetical protein
MAELNIEVLGYKVPYSKYVSEFTDTTSFILNGDTVYDISRTNYDQLYLKYKELEFRTSIEELLESSLEPFQFRGKIGVKYRWILHIDGKKRLESMKFALEV